MYPRFVEVKNNQGLRYFGITVACKTSAAISDSKPEINDDMFDIIMIARLGSIESSVFYL